MSIFSTMINWNALGLGEKEGIDDHTHMEGLMADAAIALRNGQAALPGLPKRVLAPSEISLYVGDV